MNKITNVREPDAECISSALATLGDKWTGLIIKELVAGARCYSELELALSGISPRTLSARIDKLLDSKVINKELYCDHPPRHKYALTKKGAELEKILSAMAEWGSKYSNN
jgi:DNA-binding HxlR family transcriptional regulator